jgi:hypothetical protein
VLDSHRFADSVKAPPVRGKEHVPDRFLHADWGYYQ